MSLVGLGSVSDYVMHQLHVPVLVVHTGAATAAAEPAQVSLHDGERHRCRGSVGDHAVHQLRVLLLVVHAGEAAATVAAVEPAQV